MILDSFPSSRGPILLDETVRAQPHIPALPVATSDDPTNLCLFQAMRRLPVIIGVPKTVLVQPSLNSSGVDWECRGSISATIGDKPDRNGLLQITIVGTGQGEAELIARRAGHPVGKFYIMVKADEDISVV